MSVNLEATLWKPVSLDAVLDRGWRVLADLLGLGTVPGLSVFVDRGYRQGERIDPGRRLDAAELAATVIGDPIVPDESGRSGSSHFEVDVPATGDGVTLTVIDSTCDSSPISTGGRRIATTVVDSRTGGWARGHGDCEGY